MTYHDTSLMKIALIPLTILALAFTMIAGCGESGDIATVKVRVLTEEGLPVSAADVEVTFVIHGWDSTRTSGGKGKTDTNGVFMASGRTDEKVYCAVSKDGFYLTRGQKRVARSDDQRNSNAPNQHDLGVLLKRVVHPVPMFVKDVIGMEMPGTDGPKGNLHSKVSGTNGPLGYDLKIGDWLPPFGKGQAADLRFTLKVDYRSPFDRDAELTVGFSNPRDGLIALPTGKLRVGSELRSPHLAPLDDYLSEWKQFLHMRRGQPSTNNIDIDSSRVFVLRLRTVLDENGNIKSANYGKIYGDFLNTMTHYFNPTKNDRSLEFDRKQNLSRAASIEFP